MEGQPEAGATAGDAVAAIRAVFNSIDSDGDGSLDFEELGLLLQTLGQPPVTQAELRHTAQQIDRDGSGQIEFDEFRDLLHRWQDDELHDVFAFFDDDASGTISMDEFREALHALSNNLAPSKVASLEAEVDPRGTGSVDAVAFCSFIKPFMCVTELEEHIVRQTGGPENAELKMLVSSVGVELAGRDMPSTQMLSFGCICDVAIQGSELSLTTSRRAEVQTARFVCERPLQIQTAIQKQLAKLDLRQKVALDKQKRTLRTAFDMVDASGDGVIDAQELGLLLQTLGEELTGAELRDRVRQMDRDGNGSIEFEEFAELMLRRQDEELRDVFRYFDDDASGSISVSELSKAIQALGEHGVSSDEADRRAALVDSDGSGLIDVDEFCVYMKPMMCISQWHEYSAVRKESSSSVPVKMVVSALGMQVSDEHSTRSYTFFALVHMAAAGNELVITILQHGVETEVIFATDHATMIAAVLVQQQAKLLLRGDIQKHKQRQSLRSAFDMVDVSGDGVIDAQELGVLLQTLGEELTGAELRDRARQIDGDGSGEIEFEEFAELMLRWQDQELRDVFAFFDDDASGSISVSELSKAIQALGEHGVSEEEADRRAALVDSDGSGLIDVDEFCVYMKPMMSITQLDKFTVVREEDGEEVTLTMSTLGAQVSDGETTYAYSFFTLVGIKESARGVTLTILHKGVEAEVSFCTTSAATIVSTLLQQQAKLSLRQDIQKHKQLMQLRAVFDLFDVDGGGSIEVGELTTLLQTLGQNLPADEIDAKVREFDTDNTGDISFSEFVGWMCENQEQELSDSFRFFDRNSSGTISVVELQQMVTAMGERMTQAEIQRLANHVDSDGSGEIDEDEFKVLVRPMLSLTDRASFRVEQDGERVELVVSGLGLQLVDDDDETVTYSFTKIADFEQIQAGLSITVKTKEGNLSVLALETSSADLADDILCAVKKQNGKLSLRSAIARSKEPEDSGSSTVLIILNTDPRRRTERQLAMLRSFLAEQELFQVMELESDLQQLQCCRFMRAETYEAGETIFEEGSLVYHIFNIVDGVVSVRKDGVEVRQQWKGASFGALTMTGELVAKRTPKIVAFTDVVLMKLSRADYLRISGSLEDEVLAVLAKTPAERTDAEVHCVQGLFLETQLFRMLHYSSLQLACCRVMKARTAAPGETIAEQGQHDDILGIFVHGGAVATVEDKSTERKLGTGDSVGFSCVLGVTEEDQKHASTVVATEASNLATLSRANFVHVNHELGEAAVEILEKTFMERTEEDIEQALGLFAHLPFLVRLRSKLLQQHCCRFLNVVRIKQGARLFKQGDVGDHMYIVLNGSMKVEKWRGNSNARASSKSRGEISRCSTGMSFGENCLTAHTEFGRRRATSVSAHEDSIVASLSRENYLQITRTKELQHHINEYWEMIMHDAYQDSRSDMTELCDERLYTKLHLAIAKSLHEDWTLDDASEEVKKDWINDVTRHNLGSDVLNHRQFSDALFELVDEWCDMISMEMYTGFLTKIWKNIRCFWDTTEAGVDRYTLTDLDRINSIHREMEQLKKEGHKLKKIEYSKLSRMAAKDAAAERPGSKGREGRRGAMDADEAEKVRVAFAAVDKSFRDGDSFNERASPEASAEERGTAEAQLGALMKEHDAAFVSAEEEDYFRELLQSRAVGPPQWTETMELQFRQQLPLNMPSLASDAEAMHVLLDDLQAGYIGESDIGHATQKAALHLDALTVDKGFEFTSEEARQTAIARLVRRDEGAPYWMIPGDDLAFEAFLAEHTTAISGEADGAVKLPKIPHQTLSLVGMDVSGAWEFNVAPEDGAGSFGLGLRRVKSEDWGVISKHERELRMRHLEQLECRRADFHRLRDQKVDVSHVRSKIDCGQRTRIRRKKKKRKKVKIKRPKFSPHLDAGEGTRLRREARAKASRLPPIENGPPKQPRGSDSSDSSGSDTSPAAPKLKTPSSRTLENLQLGLHSSSLEGN